jgi:hypothetical protein
MRAIRAILAVFCFGIGVALAIGAAGSFTSPYSSQEAWTPGMFSAMFFLGIFLLLRRKPSG